VAAQQAAEPAAEEDEEAAEDVAAEGEDGDEAAPPPAKKAKKAKAGKKKAGKASGGMEPALSPELAAFVGAPRMHRFKIVKAIWVYIKAHDLQDPADKRSILPDAKLGTILTAPVTMFSMNRQLNAHIIKEG
jgi:chromatin remodeling complex protein RSC6